ncbi:MAG: hypothetical protein ACYDCX_03235 [Acidithiobacillus sp.]
MKTKHSHPAPLAPQGEHLRSAKNPIQHPFHTSRHRIRHEIHLSYAANWRIKHLAKAWGLSYSEALDWLVLEVYELYKDRVPDAARLLLP